MALNSAASRAKFLAPTCSKSLSSFSVVLSSPVVKCSEDDRNRNKWTRRRALHLDRMVTPQQGILIRQFHHQNIIQLYIHQSGILFNALRKVQKSRVDVTPNDDQDFALDIPDELRRLKQGSIKWLLAVWPSSTKSYNSIASYERELQAEGEGNNEEKRRKGVKRVEKLLRPRTASEQQLFDVLDYLKGKNIAVRRLVRLPWLLTANPVALEEGVRRVRLWLKVEPFEVAISFVNIKMERLQEAGALWKFEKLEGNCKTRLDWMAKRLDCGEEDVADMMARWPKLMTLPIDTIDKILKCMLEDLKVKPEAIVSDPWMFQGKPQTIVGRAEILKANGILDVKPWIFRSPQRMFVNFMEKQLEKRMLLGESKDLEEFLQERLGKGEEILRKVPSLKTATVFKLNEMITFLMDNGFTREQICETPWVLQRSLETISARLMELSAYEPQEISLRTLCKNSLDFRAVVRQLKREAKARAKASQNKVSSSVQNSESTSSMSSTN